MCRLFITLFIISSALWAAPAAAAEDQGTFDPQVVMERAASLKKTLDRLLTESNHSSIQAVINNGDESSHRLIAEARQLKALGEQHLDEQDYLKAAMTLQTALDRVFLAIRSDKNHDSAAAALEARLSEAKGANDTFILTATRVVNGEKGEAEDILAMALAARSHADSSVALGDVEAALEELNRSTDLAQKAIRIVRNGMVIERGQ
jgi:hypothetical protein